MSCLILCLLWLFTLNACLPVCFFLSLPRRSCSFRFYTRLCCSHCTSLCNSTRAGIPVTNQLRSGFSFHEIVFYIRSTVSAQFQSRNHVLGQIFFGYNVPFTLIVQFFVLGRLLNFLCDKLLFSLSLYRESFTMRFLLNAVATVPLRRV